MIAILDYGAGNLFSVKNALDFLKIENIITKDIDAILKSDKMIIPGVGSFYNAMTMLKNQNLIDVIKNYSKIKPILGICLGMQILFEKGYENETCIGLGLIKGEVTPIVSPNLKIPHMGWNKLVFNNKNKITENLSGNVYSYFVHSFKAETNMENVIAYSEYGEKIPAIVNNGNVYGCQFHPEKSGEEGLKILYNFSRL
ncbi:MAG: imidazole glycerol phosphate synthase subunit HisH [Oscillospiraceae bacterium]